MATPMVSPSLANAANSRGKLQSMDCRILSVLVCALVSLGIGIINFKDPPLAIALMAENSVTEWAQVLLMAGVGVFAARQGWLARRAGRPVVLEVAVVTAMVIAVISEIDLDRIFFGVKVIATWFFVNPRYPLGLRALAVLVIVGAPLAVGVWLLSRSRQCLQVARETLREPWGQTAVAGAALYVVTQVLEGPIDKIPWQQHHLLEESFELLAAIVMFIAFASREGLGIRLLRAIGQRGSNFNEDRVIGAWLARVPPRHRYYVDIAAGDGATMSNTLALARAGWDGLAFEGDPVLFTRLARTYARYPRVRLANTYVTPDNVVDLLRSQGVPRDFGVLSLDIDSYDHYVLARLLEVFRPGLICAEINEAIPPPVKFTVTYRPDHAWAKDHFFGQSLAMLDALRARHGYALVQVEYNNAFLVPEEVSPVRSRPVAEVYREGYLARPDRLMRLPWNREMEYLQGLPPEQVVAALHTRFARYAGRYVCEV